MDKQTQKKLLNLVKRNYEEIAADFDNSRKKQLWPELAKLAGIVKAGDKILDAGCGNGRLVEKFLDKSAKYLGVDKFAVWIKAKLYEGKKDDLPFSFGTRYDFEDILGAIYKNLDDREKADMRWALDFPRFFGH